MTPSWYTCGRGAAKVTTRPRGSRSRNRLPWAGVSLVLVVSSLSNLGRTVFATATSVPARAEWLGFEVRWNFPFEMGCSIHACLRNPSTSPLLLEKASVSAQSVGDKTFHPIPTVWARFQPPGIPPGGVGEVIARPTAVIPERTAQIRLELKTNLGDLLTEGMAVKPRLSIRALDFPRSFDTAYLYVANVGDQPAQLAPVILNVPHDPSAVRLVNHPIPVGDVGCIALPLERRVLAGQDLYAEVGLAGARAADSTTRVIVRASTGAGVPFLAGPTSRAVNVAPSEEERGSSQRELKPLGVISSVVICPEHSLGTRERGAETGLARAVELWTQNPRALAMTYVCRRHAPRSYYDFGLLTDCSEINTCLTMHSGDEAPIPKPTECYLAQGRLAYLATRPFRLHATLELESENRKVPTPAPEARRRIWCSVVSGAKGFCYRGAPVDPVIRQAVNDVASEVQYFQEYLAIAEPVDWARTSTTGMVAASMLCGERGILVVVASEPAGPDGESAVPSPIKTVIRVRKPHGLRIGRVVGLTPGSDARMQEDGQAYLIEATVAESAEAYLLLP
jgi:hypothetical protein